MKLYTDFDKEVELGYPEKKKGGNKF